MGWGYWQYLCPSSLFSFIWPPRYKTVPSLDRFKWLEQRHMTNICNRWAQDHTNDMQHAFFNGYIVFYISRARLFIPLKLRIWKLGIYLGNLESNELARCRSNKTFCLHWKVIIVLVVSYLLLSGFSRSFWWAHYGSHLLKYIRQT